MATAGQDSRIQLWDTAEWKIRATLRGHKRAVRWLSFSSDGNHLASASDDGTVRLWQVSARSAKTIARFDHEVLTGVYAPDGQTLIVGTGDGQVSALDTQNENVRWSLARSFPIHSLAVSPDGKEMAIGFDWARHQPPEQWDLTTLPPTDLSQAHRAREPGLAPVSVVRYSPDGQTLIAGTWAGLLLRLPRDGSPQQSPPSPQLWSKPLDAIAVAPGGRTVAAAGVEGVIRVLDIETLEKLQIFIGHRDEVRGLAWLPNGESLVSAGAGRRGQGLESAAHGPSR